MALICCCLAYWILSHLDHGSFDNCGVSHFEVKRDTDNCDVPGNTQFGPSVIFCCSDVAASPISVTVRVHDNFNNYNPASIGIKFHLGK